MHSELSIIAAVARNRAIGFQNRLLYRLPDDLKRFKALTTGHTVIMGRATYDSLPSGALPHRRNVVLSRTVAQLPGCDVYPSLAEALYSCPEGQEVFVIGGARVYEQTLPLARRLYLTEIDAEPDEADAYFPSYDGAFRCVSRQWHEVDERHAQRFCFADYERL